VTRPAGHCGVAVDGDTGDESMDWGDTQSRLVIHGLRTTGRAEAGTEAGCFRRWDSDVCEALPVSRSVTIGDGYTGKNP
jgi:hypothetical protein